MVDGMWMDSKLAKELWIEIMHSGERAGVRAIQRAVAAAKNNRGDCISCQQHVNQMQLLQIKYDNATQHIQDQLNQL